MPQIDACTAVTSRGHRPLLVDEVAAMQASSRDLAQVTRGDAPGLTHAWTHAKYPPWRMSIKLSFTAASSASRSSSPCAAETKNSMFSAV